MKNLAEQVAKLGVDSLLPDWKPPRKIKKVVVEAPKPRVMFLDIEATNLKADFGYVLCVAWKWAGEDEVHHVSITEAPTFAKDPTNDRWVIQQISKVCEEADIIVFHYGSIFDYPYLQARALYHGLPLLPQTKWVDTWRIARKQLAISSNRLASIANLVNVEEKTKLSGRIWVKAMAGHKPSIKYVVEHCRQDVVVLEQVYDRIKGLRNDNPKVSHVGCPTCGSYDVHRRGPVLTVKRKMFKYQCKSCGHWFQR